VERPVPPDRAGHHHPSHGPEPDLHHHFDFLDHRLDINTTDGQQHGFAMPGLSVAEFTTAVRQGLDAVWVDVAIARPHPFDLPEADRPFTEDTERHTYDPAVVARYWRVLIEVNLILEEFAGGYSGKTSPVHHSRSAFDIALTRFADRHIDQPRTLDSVTREAYSREVISFGFWFGDENIPEPAFYSYTAPEPDGLDSEPLRPGMVSWTVSRGSHLAVLRYNDARTQPDLRATVLDFYESAYQAGARRAGSDIDRYACARHHRSLRLRPPNHRLARSREVEGRDLTKGPNRRAARPFPGLQGHSG
jgi:Family of unknown function (DUF5996)